MDNENREIKEIPEYDFGVIEIIKAGWERIDGVKLHFILGFLVYVAASIVVQLILGSIFPQGTTENPNIPNQLILGVLSIPVLVPLLVGLMMMGIHLSRGEEISYKSVFNYYHMTGILSLGAILVYIMTFIGLLLLILPGIYLSIAYMFALPLIADKQMGVWEAMEYSRKTVTKHWFKVFGLMFLLSLLVLVAIIPVGLGLIWAIPLMFVTIYALLYPVMFDGEEG